MNKSKKIILWSVVLCLLLGAAGWFGWNWYDSHVDRSGWREKDGVTMYADFHGKPVTGWLEIDGSRYYFAEDYALQTGWQTIGGSTYYLNTDGKMQRSWLEQDGYRYYFGDDGARRTSWQEIGEERYYFDEQGVMQSGWVELEARHYFHEDGKLATGWLSREEGTYHLDENGTPATGWLDEEDTRYYFLESGVLATGWTDIEENRYYFAEDGSLYTGWLEQGEYRYYLLDDGTMATGEQEIEGRTHHFTPKGIWVLLVNPWHRMPADYAPDLVEIEDGWMVDRQTLEPLKAMLEAMRAEGLTPMFSSTYRNETAQAGIWRSYVQRYMDAGYTEAQANAMTAAYVAVPGTSEHHTGLAMDIVGYDYFYGSYTGATMAVQAWLKEHCWEYGFILRYTEEKQAVTGFAAETWHFRYVGKEVSMDLKDSGLCLEEYLGAHEKK